ncbi:magnesium transporter NIPA-domain-containing protein [Apodospora peruviana]|uniref:Magnesium transporter NIPA-domain-containing protein n=1 Tax=Apodospora peruviana TaxID=516989 RepID=A0AAE0HVT8_9PEZI|nr:magnesium transporter NIPA-domain-containing protein [Apodospora peruviana]
MTSSLAIGTSFVITKKGLMQSEERHGFEGDGFIYLKNPLWWVGIGCLVLGEICNFAAYAFAPAILVTPLGALAVLIGAVLGSYFLNEELGTLGKLGSAICLIGAVIIVLHAPPDEDIEDIETILHYAIQPGFLIYGFSVIAFAIFMIYKVAPIHGKKNPLIYLSICSTVGSVSVMAVKAFGIALKLTFAGNNQFSHPSTYVFMIITAVCILTQMNYFNKALSQFPTNIVNPLYYVTFTTATLCASFILFSGFNTTDVVGTLSLLCGFLVTFTGVYLLNLSRGDPNGTKSLPRRGGGDSTGTDMISSLQTRMSMEARRSLGGGGGGPRDGLIRAYDEEEAAGFGLTDLAEDTDEEDGMDPRSPMMGGHQVQEPAANGSANGGTRLSVHGNGTKGYNDTIELQNTRKSGDR